MDEGSAGLAGRRCSARAFAMTTSLGSEASCAHRWQDVTVLAISIAGIGSSSHPAGPKVSGAHRW